MTPQQDEMLKQLHTAIVGDESLGHSGLVKRMKNVEKIVEDHDPIIQSYMTEKTEKAKDKKSMRTLIIGGCVTFITGLAIQIIVLLNHK
jgi:hypothetical protein